MALHGRCERIEPTDVYDYYISGYDFFVNYSKYDSFVNYSNTHLFNEKQCLKQCLNLQISHENKKRDVQEKNSKKQVHEKNNKKSFTNLNQPRKSNH